MTKIMIRIIMINLQNNGDKKYFLSFEKPIPILQVLKIAKSKL